MSQRLATAPPSALSSVEPLAGRRLLGPDRVDGLVGDRLERGAGQVGSTVAAREPDDRPARVGIPVRRAEPGQGRHEVDVVVGVEGGGQPLGLRRLRDHAEPVAQPLHGGAGDEDRGLERVVGALAEAPGDRREQALPGVRRLRAGVEQHEAAGPVGVLCAARVVARLAEERRLLVARDPGDGDVAAELAGAAVDLSGGDGLRAAPPDRRRAGRRARGPRRACGCRRASSARRSRRRRRGGR